MPAGPPPARPRWLRPLAAWNGLVFAAWVAGPFLAAGTLHWAAGWSYLGALAAGLLLHGVHVRRRNPALAAHRRRPGPGTRGWDLAWNALFWPLMAAGPIAAGLALRAGSPPLPGPLWAAGALVLGGGLALSARAMAVNPHFEGTVRVQRERGHPVIEAGPYRRLRHPGYLGLILWALATPLLLRAGAALAPAGLAAAWVVLRTGLEDALLRRELPGYREYAARTRFRLLPGVW